MNFCCPPPKLSLRSTQGLAYDSDSWWSNRLAELNSLAMSWVRGQEHENKNFWYSIPMGESPIFLLELLITKLTRQVCIINTYSTYRTSSICIHTATFPPQAPFVWCTYRTVPQNSKSSSCLLTAMSNLGGLSPCNRLSFFPFLFYKKIYHTIT